MRTRLVNAAPLICLLLLGDNVAAMEPPPALPEDTVIRILLVNDTGLAPEDVTGSITFLKNSWSGTSFTSSSLTTIQIVNNELPIPAPSSLEIFTGDADEQRDKLRDFVEMPVTPGTMSLRELHSADVVIGLSSNIDDACGFGKQFYWRKLGPIIPFIGGFSPDESGLDTRRKNEDYIAVARVNTVGSCGTFVLAHEFGHLLGAAHIAGVFGITGGLLFDSRAWRRYVWGWVAITALGNGVGVQTDCPSPTPSNCVHLPLYSNPIVGSTGYQNANAMSVTARSVANYRVGGGEPMAVPMCGDGFDNDGDTLVDSNDPDCAVCNAELCPVFPPPPPPPNCDATVAPHSVVGELMPDCPGNSKTEYRMTWSHACPEAVTDWEIWTTQPLGGFPGLDWTRTVQFTPVFISGQQGRLWVVSCGVGGCSGLSGSSFIATDICP